MSETEDEAPDPPIAALYHRTGGGERDRLGAVVARLTELEQRGVVRVERREPWPDRVPMRDGSSTVHRYERFRDWADRHGVSVEPPFRIADVSSSIIHAADEVLETPSLCLALAEGDELRAVYPHTTDDRLVTVTEGVNALDPSPEIEASAEDPGSAAMPLHDGKEEPTTS